MPAWDGSDERLRAERQEPHRRIGIGVSQHREVELAADDAREQRRRVALGEFDADERVPLAERLDALDRTEWQRGHHEADVEPPGLPTPDPHDLVEVPLRLVEQRASPSLQHPPGRGQGDAARGPDEQFHPEVALGPTDLLGQRRLCDAQSPGGSSEVQLVGHGEERPELPQVDIHAHSLSIGTNEYWT